MSNSVRSGTAPGTGSASRRSTAVCALIGAAVMTPVDETVFHRILGWHHFYDRSTSGVGLLSDGLLHTAELLATDTARSARGTGLGWILGCSVRRRIHRRARRDR